MGVVRVELDESVAGGDGRGRFVVFIIGVGKVELGLLGMHTERVPGEQLFVVLDGLGVVLGLQRLFSLGV